MLCCLWHYALQGRLKSCDRNRAQFRLLLRYYQDCAESDVKQSLLRLIQSDYVELSQNVSTVTACYTCLKTGHFSQPCANVSYGIVSSKLGFV